MKMPEYNQEIKESYTNQEIYSTLMRMVAKMESSAEYMARTEDMTVEDSMTWAQLSAGVVIAIGELLGEHVASEIFTKKAAEARAAIQQIDDLEKDNSQPEVMH